MEMYPVYVVVVIFTISLVCFSENAGADDIATYVVVLHQNIDSLWYRGNCTRLHGYAVIMRLGLVISMVPWLWASLTQERPCVCKIGMYFVEVTLFSFFPPKSTATRCELQKATHTGRLVWFNLFLQEKQTIIFRISKYGACHLIPLLLAL